MAGLITEVGTPPQRWHEWPGLTRLPALDLSGCDRMLVVAAHPDDETLGAGALLGAAARRAVEVQVLVLTEGEASHPGSPTLDPGQLAALRRAEVRVALDLLGVRTAATHAGLRDGGLAGSQAAVAAAIGRGLAAPFEAAGRDWILAPWRGDGHPDHEAAGRAAAAVCAATGARLVEYLVWAWHWAEPADLRVPWGRVAVHRLDDAARVRKRAAVAAFRTQVEPLSPHPADAAIVPVTLLDAVCGPVELLVVDPP